MKELELNRLYTLLCCFVNIKLVCVVSFDYYLALVLRGLLKNHDVL